MGRQHRLRDLPTGTVELGTDGQLQIHGTAKANIVVKQLSFFGFPLTSTPCHTTPPVEFGLTFGGPVSALGSGGLSFSGAATIPAITGCESDLFGRFVGPLLSAPNNQFRFTVTPPDPDRA